MSCFFLYDLCALQTSTGTISFGFGVWRGLLFPRRAVLFSFWVGWELELLSTNYSVLIHTLVRHDAKTVILMYWPALCSFFVKRVILVHLNCNFLEREWGSARGGEVTIPQAAHREACRAASREHRVLLGARSPVVDIGAQIGGTSKRSSRDVPRRVGIRRTRCVQYQCVSRMSSYSTNHAVHNTYWIPNFTYPTALRECQMLRRTHSSVVTVFLCRSKLTNTGQGVS